MSAIVQSFNTRLDIADWRRLIVECIGEFDPVRVYKGPVEDPQPPCWVITHPVVQMQDTTAGICTWTFRRFFERVDPEGQTAFVDDLVMRAIFALRAVQGLVVVNAEFHPVSEQSFVLPAYVFTVATAVAFR